MPNGRRVNTVYRSLSRPLPINPLDLTITYFREDEAFK